jgi:hypothetical protein
MSLEFEDPETRWWVGNPPQVIGIAGVVKILKKLNT